MIRELNLQDADRCAAIHFKNAQEWSHNAQMGEGHLRSIYRAILGSKECFGFGYFKDDELVCFITATTDFSSTMKNLKKLIGFKQYIQLFKQVLRHPGELFDMFESRFVIPGKIKAVGIKPYLLTWHNNFDLEYIPMAPILVMKRALRAFHERGFDYCMTQVDANNARPNRFYRSIQADAVFSSKHNNIYKVRTLWSERQRSA
ncbi:MAG TPA: hypothetical protein VI749_06870 [Candidatus Omnitrophota bacterium]|nr:hypothetical protein [Candidatus Omnitrophota bacterium]